MDNEFTIYNYNDLYEEQLVPLINQIKEICTINSIPFYISIASANENGKTVYKNDGVLPGSFCINLYDNKYETILVAIQDGAKLQNPGSLDFEDIVNSEDFMSYTDEATEDDPIVEYEMDDDTPIVEENNWNNIVYVGDI